MDVLLLTTVASSTVGLSNQLPPMDRQALYYVRTSLGLSLSLFSLGILDASPASWRLILPQDGIFLTTAYRIVLWAIALLGIVVGPFGIGRHLSLPEVHVPRIWILQCMFLLLQRCGTICVWTIRRLLRMVVCCSRTRRTSQLPLHVSGPTTGSSGSSNSSSRLINSESSASNIQQLIGGTLGVLSMMLLLHTLGPLVMQQSEDSSYLTKLISSMSAVGIIVSSVLNGFGSVSMPFNFLKGLYLPQVQTETVASAELELEKATNSLSYRRQEWLSKFNRLGGSSWNSVNTKNLSFSDMGDAVSQRRKKLETEMDFLQTLVDELADNVTELRQAQAVAAGARTPWGRVRSFVGVVFSIILVVRLLGACYAILLTPSSSTNRTDLVTIAMVSLMGRDWVASAEYNNSYNTIQQGVSLLLTAVLSVTQLRTFLRTWSAVQRRLSQYCCYRPCATSTMSTSIKSDIAMTTSSSSTAEVTSTLPQIMALLLTSYCLACSVLTKKMLPAQYHNCFSEALTDDFAFSMDRIAVHGTFVMSAVVSTSILGALLGIQRQQTSRYQQYDMIAEP